MSDRRSTGATFSASRCQAEGANGDQAGSIRSGVMKSLSAPLGESSSRNRQGGWCRPWRHRVLEDAEKHRRSLLVLAFALHSTSIHWRRLDQLRPSCQATAP